MLGVRGQLESHILDFLLRDAIPLASHVVSSLTFLEKTTLDGELFEHVDLLHGFDHDTRVRDQFNYDPMQVLVQYFFDLLLRVVIESQLLLIFVLDLQLLGDVLVL